LPQAADSVSETGVLALKFMIWVSKVRGVR
jgi:hypothetical protein